MIYNINPVYNSQSSNGNNNNGNESTIGVVGRSDPYQGGEDISNFRNYAFELCCGNYNIVLNGPDPGDLGGGEEAEATLDSTWSGAVAPGATVIWWSLRRPTRPTASTSPRSTSSKTISPTS